jgi:Ca-activated chloride channel family protein
LIVATAVLTACDFGGSEDSVEQVSGGGVSIPENAIQISIVYAPESDLYLPDMIRRFNQSYADGVNPVTGDEVTSGERPIYVTGEPGSSGVVMQQIVNAITIPNSSNIAQPTIFEPSVSHWLALANYQAGRQIFDLSEARATALAPVVMAIWESRLEAIRNTVAAERGVDPSEVEIGWEELLDVLNSENGWQDYGIEGGRRTVYYGHTDPFISSTALSTLIAEFYASARNEGFTGAEIGLTQVNDSDVQQGVRSIEQLIRHYSRRTTEFKEYIAQGPAYLDFVALEENDLIFINQGRTEISPPEPLVALYPKEGTFWHEHPFAIVNANWVTPEQRDAARVFTDFVLLPENQELIMAQGFRPANPDVPLGFPIEESNGVTTNVNDITVLEVPEPEVIAAIQESWAFVKKQADIWLVMDVSGSMNNDNKLEQAKQAALTFLDGIESSNRVGLAVFSDEPRVIVNQDTFESNEQNLRQAINRLQAEGNTALYDAVVDRVDTMSEEEDANRIRAVVVLSDGADNQSARTLNDVSQAIAATRNDLNPVIVIPVAYGEGATGDETAIRALNSIARASNTRVQSGDPSQIQGVLEIISSYF